MLIDECEDREDKKATLELNLSGIGASRFSSRIYDLQHLKRLILSNNKLTRLNPDIKYLIKYVFGLNICLTSIFIWFFVNVLSVFCFSLSCECVICIYP